MHDVTDGIICIYLFALGRGSIAYLPVHMYVAHFYISLYF